MKWWDRKSWSLFFECWVLSQLFHSPLSTFIKRLFSSSSLSAIRVVSSVYVRLLLVLPAILIPACASSSPAFHMMYSAYKLNKQSDNIQPWHIPFPIWNQSVVPRLVVTVVSWPTYRFHERGKVALCSHLFKNFPVCCDLHIQRFNVVSEAEVDVFSWVPLLFLWSNRCWQFDLWFLCLF